MEANEHEALCDTLVANFISSKRKSFGYDLDDLSKLSNIPKLRLFELEQNKSFISIKSVECKILESIFKLEKDIIKNMALGLIQVEDGSATQ